MVFRGDKKVSYQKQVYIMPAQFISGECQCQDQPRTASSSSLQACARARIFGRLRQIYIQTTTGSSMSNSLRTLLLVLGFTVLAPAAMAAGDAGRGEKLATTCAACHGADGNSPAPTFPKLAGLGEKYLTKQLVDIKTKVRVVPEMTGLLDNLSDQDLADLAAYYAGKPLQLAGARKLEVQLNSGAKEDALVLGERLYRAGNATTQTPACSGCHSPRGLGNDPASFPRLSGQYAEYIEKQLRDFRAGNRVNDGEAQVMRKVAEHLSDAEIVALANYIAGLH
jgi:cytochrome c553